MPVVGHIVIKFRLPLSPFQRFSLNSRLLYWDEKWLYLEQRLESAKGVHSTAIVRGLFLKRNGVAVPTQKIFDYMGYRGDAPTMPEAIRRMVA
jgi:hypothetical protein